MHLIGGLMVMTGIGLYLWFCEVRSKEVRAEIKRLMDELDKKDTDQ